MNDSPTTETTTAATEPAEDATTHPEGDADETQGDGPNREAARYRRRLREAEAERDALSARVEALQRAEVERIAESDKLRPAALWASGAELAEMLSADGSVDAQKVAAAIESARQSLGIARHPGRNVVPGEGKNPHPGRAASRGLAGMAQQIAGRGDY